MDYIALYAAGLSTVIAITGTARYLYNKRVLDKEKDKVHISLNKMITNKPNGERVDIAFILFANLGKNTIVIKEVKFKTNDGGEGSPGWYEEPSATYGKMKRVLPAVLKTGDVVELPLFYYKLIDHSFTEMTLVDIENKIYHVPSQDLERIKRENEG
jgi:hypothetical protein